MSRTPDPATAHLSAGGRRRLGAYYTPLPVVRFLVAETLGPVVRGEKRMGEKKGVPLSPEEILGLRVLDPAMGAGYFLTEAADFLADAFRKAGGKLARHHEKIVSKCLYGVDIDPVAVEEAKKSLAVSGRHLKAGDALIDRAFDGLPAGHPIFDWDRRFPEVFQSPSPGFDAIVGNPPYVSFGLRGVGKIDKSLRAHYLATYPDSAQYKISVYALFIERSMALLSPVGRLGFILPDSFLLGKYFQRLRETVLRWGACVESLTLFQRSFWRGGEVGRPVIMIAESRADRRRRIRLSKVRDLESLEDGTGSTFRVRYREYCSTPYSRFYFFRSKCDLDLYRRIGSNSVPLSHLVKFYSGLIGKAGRDSIVFDGDLSKDHPLGRSRLVDSGKHLTPFRIDWPGRYIVHDRSLYKSGYMPSFYAHPKLLLNQTGDSPKACVDESGLFCLNNLHIGLPECGLDGLYLAAAILNSAFGRAYYRFLSMEEGRAMAQIDIDVIDLFPMPAGSLEAVSEGREDAAARCLRDIIALSRRLHALAAKNDPATFQQSMDELDALVLAAYEIGPEEWEAFRRP